MHTIRRNLGPTGYEIGLHPRKGASHGFPVVARPQQHAAVDGVQGRAIPGVLRPHPEQRWAGGEHGDRLPALLGDLARPGPRGVENEAATEAVSPIGLDRKSRCRARDGGHLGLLDKLGSRPRGKARDDACGSARFGDGIALRPGRARDERREHRPASPRGRTTEELDLKAGAMRLAGGLFQLRLVARGTTQIDMTAPQQAAVLAAQAGKVLPDRLRPQRQGKFGPVAALQAQIAEIAAARGGAGLAFFDHHHRAAARRRK